MTFLKPGLARLCLGLITLATLCALPSTKVLAEDTADDVAFPEKFMFRISNYSINKADTSVTVLNEIGVGVGYSFSRDFNTDDEATVPRIDMYYRFNERHRIDFSTFSSERKGEKVLSLEVEIGDETFAKGEVLKSGIEYELYRLGYSYSFYHSETVELAVSVGLNVTNYDLSFSNNDGTVKEGGDATAPLPMFGVQMGYAITPNWSIHYLMETFFIEIENTYKGTFFNNEVSVQYRFFDNFLVGLGITRVGVDLDVNESGWKGEIVDSYEGYLLSLGYYF